jgi:hypothetical protein
MPEAPLSPQERTLQVFCRIFAVVYALGAIGFAVTPRLTFRLITLGRAPGGWTPQAVFWNVLACAMMTAISTSCAVVAGRPRERRHALLPVIVAKLTSSGLALAHLLRPGGPGSMALIVVVATDFPLFVLTLLVYRAAAPGVHSAPAREGPPSGPPKVQIGISKAN